MDHRVVAGNHLRVERGSARHGSQPETAFGSRIGLLNGDLGGATG